MVAELEDFPKHDLCTCMVGPLLLGIEVGQVQEVLYQSAFTKVPRTGPCIAGLINLRGQIATAIDLRRRLNVDPSPDADNVHIVLNYGGEPVSLIVDDIGDVITVSRSLLEPPPQTASETTRELFFGTYKLDEHLLLALDTDRTIATSAVAAKGPTS